MNTFRTLKRRDESLGRMEWYRGIDGSFNKLQLVEFVRRRETYDIRF
jgi:hypothetical protein